MRLTLAILLQSLALFLAWYGHPGPLIIAGMCSIGVIWLRCRFYIKKPEGATQ
jgi:hypothetical protein